MQPAAPPVLGFIPPYPPRPPPGLPGSPGSPGQAARNQRSRELQLTYFGGSPTVVEVSENDTENDQQTMATFSDKNIRRAFIKKVYGILTLQLIVTIGIVAMFLKDQRLIELTVRHPELIYAAAGCMLTLMIVLICCDDCRRVWPANIIMLMLFTFCQGWLLATISVTYQVEEVLLAGGMCTVVCLAVTVLAFLTKIDFTGCGGLLLVLLVVGATFASCVMWLPSRDGHLRTGYSAAAALLFSFFLVVDTQMMMGGHRSYSISPEEYVFAALSIYLDVIRIFLEILKIVGSSDT